MGKFISKVGRLLGRAMIIGLSGLMVACGSNTTTSAVKNAIFGVRGNLLNPEQVKIHGDSIIQAKLGKQKAILEKRLQSGDVIFWQGIGATLATRNGRVVQLTGTEVELRRTSFSSPDPLGLVKNLNGAGLTRKLDYMPKYFYDIEAKSKFIVSGRQNISVLGFKKNLLKVYETVIFKNFNQKHTNVYWLDPNTLKVWKSKQYYAPHAKPIVLEQVHFSSNVLPAAPQTPQVLGPAAKTEVL